MRQALAKPRAMMTMAANRSAEHRADQMADLIETVRNSAVRITELTALAAELQDRVAALEGRQ